MSKVTTGIRSEYKWETGYQANEDQSTRKHEKKKFHCQDRISWLVIPLDIEAKAQRYQHDDWILFACVLDRA